MSYTTGSSSCLKLKLLGPRKIYTDCIRTEKCDERDPSPILGPHSISVHSEPTFGHLRHHLRDVPLPAKLPTDSPHKMIMHRDQRFSFSLPSTLSVNENWPQRTIHSESRCTVLKVGAHAARRTGRHPESVDQRQLSDPQSKSLGPTSAASSCPQPEFLLAAQVPVNPCPAPRRHGRITHQPEDVPHGGFGPDLPCYPPLSHGSSRLEVERNRWFLAPHKWACLGC